MENGGGNGGKALPNGAAENGKAVQALERSFGEVQRILEHNRMLIQEIGQNQEAREPGGLNRNVALIRELNSNIARVVNLYGELTNAFSKSIINPAADAAKGGDKRPRAPQ
jgi:phage tail tape-measure protein